MARLFLGSILLISGGVASGSGCALIAGLEDGELAPPDGGTTNSSTGSGGSPSGSGGSTDVASSSSSAGGSGGSGMGGSGGAGGVVNPEPGMVIIPAGPFMMGCNSGVDNLCDNDEKPYHQVTLSAFQIDITEVSRGDYKKCIDAGSCMAPPCDWDPVALAKHPVTCVTWTDAFNYCKWASKRLPTEAEWEKASRSDGGYKFPWKAEFNDDCSLVNANLCMSDTAPVDGHVTGASPYGVLNMSGNAAEWVNDFYDASYYAASPAMDPKGPASGTIRVIRGGSWNSPTTDFRCSSRSAELPTTLNEEIGFRCAK